MLRCALISAVCALAAATATAQVPRNFPATALRGEIVVTQPPDLLLNKQPARLAPGARIRAQSNLLEVSGAIAGQRLLVHYTLDLYGQLNEVWVLTPEEAARRPWPATPQQAATWQFDAAAQTWSRP